MRNNNNKRKKTIECLKKITDFDRELWKTIRINIHAHKNNF